MQIIQVELEKLIPNPENCRIHTPDNIALIKRSLALFEQYKPLVVQTSTNKILVGNGTYVAVKELGWQTVGVVFVDVDDDRAAIMAIADNRTAELSFWDINKLHKAIENVALDLVADFKFDEKFIKKLANTQVKIPKVPSHNPDVHANTSGTLGHDQRMIKCPGCGHEYCG